MIFEFGFCVPFLLGMVAGMFLLRFIYNQCDKTIDEIINKEKDKL